MNKVMGKIILKTGLFGLVIVGILSGGCARSPEERDREWDRINLEFAQKLSRRGTAARFDHQGMRYVGYVQYVGGGMYRLVDGAGGIIVEFDPTKIDGGLRLPSMLGEPIGKRPVE